MPKYDFKFFLDRCSFFGKNNLMKVQIYLNISKKNEIFKATKEKKRDSFKHEFHKEHMLLMQCTNYMIIAEF